MRRMMAVMETARLATAGAWEQEGSADGKVREISGAVEATFLPRRMVVCIDLVRGSLVCDEVAAPRTSDPWYALGEARGET